MKKTFVFAAIGLSLIASPAVHAGERTVTLAVKNMYCASCPAIVKKSLQAVPGVLKTVVSYKEQTAIVTYDDSKTSVNMLTAAATRAGYPSEVRAAVQ
ncbi:MAG TPA: mercury resistance system periplasmic binding protein MerP [Xanthobacteraceae bacterium]|nr:mercury resistance system periplasmic binding protein MerP [Xanthobacteraceae bacterium]